VIVAIPWRLRRLLLAYYWLTLRNIGSAHNAYTDGRAITIAPQISGTVVSLDADNQFVKQGRNERRMGPAPRSP
jgi:multidrug resistance efflux pump